MKSTSPFITSNRGFVFPFVLLASAAIFILIISAIELYKTEQKLTKNLFGHLQVETIYQMSLHELREEFSTKNPGVKSLNRELVYPQGRSKIILSEHSETIYIADFVIFSNEGVSYTFSHQIEVPPRNHESTSHENSIAEIEELPNK